MFLLCNLSEAWRGCYPPKGAVGRWQTRIHTVLTPYQRPCLLCYCTVLQFLLGPVFRMKIVLKKEGKYPYSQESKATVTEISECNLYEFFKKQYT